MASNDNDCNNYKEKGGKKYTGKPGEEIPYLLSNKNNKQECESIKKGVVYGGVGGLIASIGFTGIMLWMPIIYGFPPGIFMHALGIFIVSPLNDPISIGFAAFLIIVIQGIIVGITFGIVTSKIKRLNTNNKKKGIVLGLCAGIIAYLVLYLPVTLTLFPNLLSRALSTYSQVELSMIGLSSTDYSMAFPSQPAYTYGVIGWGFIAYLSYGFFMGGIVTLAYSIHRFDAGNMAV
ncbi:MAG: hypothetical protein M3Y53_07330 [Thermoproteota archaeon]|nr:hypothetical protein [Thermoproteota archaeon]